MITRRSAVSKILVFAAAIGLPVRINANTGDESQRFAIWTTFDGRKIRICDLTDEHLRNIIFFLNKRFGESFGTMVNHSSNDVAYVELQKGGPSQMYPLYDVLRHEATRRNLSWI